MKRLLKPTITLLLLVLCALALGLTGCANDMAFGDDANQGALPDEPRGISAAEEALRLHDVEGARAIYAELLREQPTYGAAAAGLAVTDLLLVLGMEEVEELLVEHLGARRGIDANRLLFSEEGYLYWASKGVRWEDDGPYQGIETLLAEEMPWDRERLESIAAFVDGLDQPMEQLARKMVSLANSLRGLDMNLEVAIEDPDFVRIFVPGQVFHDSELTLVLGKSELSALRTIIALFRSATYFVAAYEHDWDLQRAFGGWRENVEVTDRNYVPGFEPRDYTYDYLDGNLGRTVAFPERLAASRSALQRALRSARDTIRFGLEEISSTTMTWEQVDRRAAQDLDEVLGALLQSLDGPAGIPHTEPHLTVDLSTFFEEGRVLSGQIPWFVQVDLSLAGGVDGDEELPEYLWRANEEALEVFFLQGVITPRPEGDIVAAVLPGEQGLQPYIEITLGKTLDSFRDVFLTTR